MTETLIGTFSRREYAEREALSLQEDAPEGVRIELRINDGATWDVVEVGAADEACEACGAERFERCRPMCVGYAQTLV